MLMDMRILIVILAVFLFHCDQKSGTGLSKIKFTDPIKISVNGYSGNIMEPFISRDGSVLLFNNLNAAPENTNLHWAIKVNDTTFEYKGEIAGLNTIDLEGVASLDNTGELYFVSTRNYTTTLSTIYQCEFANGIATNVRLVDGVSKRQAGWLNFDVEVSNDGNTLYYVDGLFGPGGTPSSADLVIAEKNGASFQIIPNSNSILQNINTNALEYAACISADQLELYFTRLQSPITASSSPEIFVTTRQNRNEPFGVPYKIESIKGFAEAATIAPDQKTIYFHMKENDKFGLYMVRKK